MFYYYRAVIILIFCLVLPGVGFADSVCFKCHERKAFSGKIVHKPLVDGQCTVCHNPHVSYYKGLLEAEGAALCFSCHKKEEKIFQQGMVHQPVRSGQCLSCHVPHASSEQGLLKQDISSSCFVCHEKLQQKYQFNHLPYAQKKCFECHLSHKTVNGRLLKNEPDKLCLSCHKTGELQKGHPNYPATLQNCLSCHNPHGSSRKGLVRDVLHKPFIKGCKECHENGKYAGDPVNCLRCHQGVAAGIRVRHSHLTGNSENKCVECHSPHAGDNKSLLKGSQLQLCRKCHNDTIVRYENKPFRHPKAKQGICTDCHEVHGSNRIAMLKGDGNAICTGCHETQGKFTHPVGEKVIDIRNGQMVTCISCHQPMGSEFKYELVLSGSRDLCLQCHKRY